MDDHNTKNVNQLQICNNFFTSTYFVVGCTATAIKFFKLAFKKGCEICFIIQNT